MINYVIKKVKDFKYTNCTVCDKRITKKHAFMRVARSGAMKMPVCKNTCK